MNLPIGFWGENRSIYDCHDGTVIKHFKTNFFQMSDRLPIRKFETGFGMIASHFYPNLFVRHEGLLDNRYLIQEKCDLDLVNYLNEIVKLEES